MLPVVLIDYMPQWNVVGFADGHAKVFPKSTAKVVPSGKAEKVTGRWTEVYLKKDNGTYEVSRPVSGRKMTDVVNASSAVATRTTESTGPKISSCSSREPGRTPVKIVGSKK